MHAMQKFNKPIIVTMSTNKVITWTS